MKRAGLTSVTFRNLNPDDIIQAAVQAQLQGIEWGSDVHVLPGKLKEAADVARKCRAAGLEVIAYGAYYKLCQGHSPETDFGTLAETAKALEAPLIRIWAGRTPSALADDAFFQAAAEETRACCCIAAKAGLEVAFEYHRKSLTDCRQSALRLLKAVDCPNLKTYWQPNPEISVSENQKELQAMLPWLRHVHVFSWLPDNQRLALSEGNAAWQSWLKDIPEEVWLSLEFVKEDSLSQFYQDAETLRSWLKKTA